jgi:hypothetical protein
VGQSNFRLELFKIDLKPQKIAEIKETSENLIRFKNLAKGDYVIYLKRWDGCQLMIGGIEGIEVKEEEGQ